MKELEETEMVGAAPSDMETTDPLPLFRVMLVKVLLSEIERFAVSAESSINGEESKVKPEMRVETNRREPLQVKRADSEEEEVTLRSETAMREKDAPVEMLNTGAVTVLLMSIRRLVKVESAEVKSREAAAVRMIID